jgi:hypothetical protein
LFGSLSPYASDGSKVIDFFSQIFIQTTALSKPEIICHAHTVKGRVCPLS